MEILKGKELAGILGVHRVTLLNWRKKGMPFIETPTGLIRYDKEKVMEWLNANNGKGE